MAQAQQFIGSKISLISKSEIRYEGILYSLDLQEATISLSKVRSFGTEDRQTERPVPAKDEVYEFIIFRGSDIKGIDVVEPPSSAVEQPGPPSDPAILEVSQQYHTPGSAAVGGPTRSQQQQQHQQQQPMSSAYAQFSGSSGGGASKPAEKQQQPFSSTTAVISPLQQQHNNHHGNHGAPDGVEHRRADSTRSTSPKPLMQGVENRQRQEGRGRGRGGQNYQHQPQRYNNNYHGGGGGGGGGGGYNRGGRPPYRGGYGLGGGRGGPTGSFTQTGKKTTFAEEFDFEKSNEELLNALTSMKIKEAEQEEKEEEKDDEVYYAKDNFFDNISCEALERSKGKSNRPDWRAERKLNAETFGISERRGGGYYRGGRGFYRGGGYGYNRGGYNNRGGGGYYRGGGGGGGYYRGRGGGGNRDGGGGGGRGGRQEDAAAAN